MKKIILLIGLFLLTFQLGFGCSCGDDLEVKVALKYHHAVFLGQVISIDTINRPVYINDNDTTFWKFHEVRFIHKKSFKGKFYNDTVKVVIGAYSGYCGYYFEVGKTYVVYTNWNSDFILNKGKKQFLETDICTRTTNDYNKEMRAIYYSKGFRFRKFQPYKEE